LWAVSIRGSILPFWLSLYASVCSLLTEIACCHFVKDQLFPFWFGICSSILLQIWTLSFLPEIRSSVLLQISTPSFLAEICPSLLLQILTLSFLAEIAHCSSVPLHHNPIFHLSHHWIGMYTTKRSRDIPGHHTYWALCVVLEKRWKVGTLVIEPQRLCPILGSGDPGHFCLIGLGRTRPYSNNNQHIWS